MGKNNAMKAGMKVMNEEMLECGELE